MARTRHLGFKRLRVVTLVLLACIMLFQYWNAESEELHFDLVIRGARVVDGTGAPSRTADVGLRGAQIAFIGKLRRYSATDTIDGTGMVLSPGFIDVHTHVERNLPSDGSPFVGPNFALQGVTTVITGNCGSSHTDIRSLYENLGIAGAQLNLASLIGHGAVRREVMGEGEAEPSPEQLAAMAGLVDSAMAAGALGLSTGLAYVPGVYSNQEELVELANVVARWGGIHASHIRSEGIGGVEAIQEVIDVARLSEVRTHISHFKASGRAQWGTAGERLGLVDDQQISIDVYPYSASSTDLSLLLPPGVSVRNRRAWQSQAFRERVGREMRGWLQENGWDDYGFSVVAAFPPRPSWVSLSIKEIAEKGEFGSRDSLSSQIRVIMEIARRGGAQMIYHDMNEADLEEIMGYHRASFGTDSSVRFPNAKIRPHPRGMGTFPRILARYVRERGVLSVEEAVRRMTSLPAERFQLPNRGTIAVGAVADLVLFDLAAVADRATYDQPLEIPRGIRDVIVHGTPILRDLRFTGENPGQVLSAHRQKSNRPTLRE